MARVTASARRRVKALSRAAGQPALLVSGATGEGVPQVLSALGKAIRR
ncbi:hypothetical protein J4558_18905 [Leptolyngbya sp. 15MV]|nr:hypothetical protein J4558_18905 [Leptolyngbya sp. 15MV]